MRFIRVEYGKKARDISNRRFKSYTYGPLLCDQRARTKARSCDFSCGWHFGSRLSWRCCRAADHSRPRRSTSAPLRRCRRRKLPSPTWAHSAGGSPTLAASDRKPRSRSDIERRQAPRCFTIISTSILGPRTPEPRQTPQTARLSRFPRRVLRSTRFRRLIWRPGGAARKAARRRAAIGRPDRSHLGLRDGSRAPSGRPRASTSACRLGHSFLVVVRGLYHRSYISAKAQP